MGKRKIAIERIEKRNKRFVTFSKRRKGLFKKGADACLKFDARISMLVFSPAGKPFSFGPIDSMIDEFLNKIKINQRQQQHQQCTATCSSIQEVDVEIEEEEQDHGVEDYPKQEFMKQHEDKDDDDEISRILKEGDGFSWPSEEDWSYINSFNHL